MRCNPQKIIGTRTDENRDSKNLIIQVGQTQD